MEKWPLPEGWGWKQLDTLAEIKTIAVKPASTPDKLFNYLGLDALAPNSWLEPEENIVRGADIKSSCVYFDQNYVLYAKLRPYLNKVVVPKRAGIATTELIPIWPNQEVIDREYLGWFLRTPAFVKYAVRNSTGARMPRVASKAFWQASVPIPYVNDPVLSLDTQRRLVVHLEALLADLGELQQTRERIQNLTSQLMNAVLYEVFPNPEQTLPNGWEVRTVAELGLKPQYGYTESAKDVPVGPKFLRITDIQEGKVDWGSVPYCECPPAQISKYQLADGDIVFARTGATTGKTFLVKKPPLAVFASYLIRLRIQQIVTPDFLYWFFQSPYYWSQVVPRGSARPNMNAQVLQQVKVPCLISKTEQAHLVAYLENYQESVTEMQRTQDEQFRKLDLVGQSILTQAFRGEL